MIKSQRFIPFLFKSLQKPLLPLTFINNMNSNQFSKGLVFNSFANFSNQNDSGEILEKSDETLIEEWGAKAPKIRGRFRCSIILSDYYVKVALRVMETCIIYGESTADELAKLTKESRFYYVKKTFDEMDEQDAKGFVKFLKEKNDIATQIVKEKLRLKGIAESDLTRKAFSALIVGERDNLSFIGNCLQRSPRYRAIIGELIMEFLDPENPDFRSLLMIRAEENRIGELKPPRRQYKKLGIMAEHKEELRQKLKKIIDQWEKKDPKEFETIKVTLRLKKSESQKKQEEQEREEK